MITIIQTPRDLTGSYLFYSSASLFGSTMDYIMVFLEAPQPPEHPLSSILACLGHPPPFPHFTLIGLPIFLPRGHLLP